MKLYQTLKLASAVASTALLTPALHAANIWDGGGADGNWSTVDNWDNNAVPGSGALTFAGELQTSTTNDLGAATYAGINFTNNGTAGKTGAFTLAGDSITLGGNITTTAGGSITDTISLGLALNADRTFTMNTGHNLVVSGIISDDGNRQLIKNGAGVLTLSGANTFGRLNHDAGTVRAGASGTVFGDVDVNLAGGTTLDLDGNNVTIGGLETSTGSSITLGAGTLTFGDGSNRTVRSVISGSGKIIYAGTAQHQFGANSGEAPDNTHTGGTQVDGSGNIGHRLKIYADKSLGASNGDVIFNGGTIYVNGGTGLTSPSTRGFILNDVPGSTILYQGNNDWRIEGPISGPGGIILRQNPNGDTEGRLFGTNSFNGPLRIQGTSGGAMRVWITNLADSPTQNGNIIFGNEYFSLNDNNTTTLYLDSSAAAPLTFANRSIEFEGNGDATGYLRNDNSTHAVTVSTPLVVSGTGLKYFNLYGVNSTPVNVFSGVIADGSGTVRLRIAGNGQWTISGANTHTGGTELAGGALHADSAGGDALGAGYLNRTNGTLALGANQNVSELYVNGVQQPNGVYDNADYSWIDDDGGTYTLTVGTTTPSYWDSDDATAGAGGATPTGTWGTDNFWSDSAAGDVATAAWTAGRTATFAAGTDATGTYTVTVNGTQDISGLSIEEGNVTLTGGGLRLTANSLLYVDSGDSATVATPISDDGTAHALKKIGTGVLTVQGANTYTGTSTLTGGILVADSTTALGSGNISFEGGTLRYTSTTAATDFSAGGRMKNSASAITVDTNGENVTLAGDIDNSNTGGLTKTGAGTLTLTGTNSFSGSTTISQGSLVIDGGTSSSPVSFGNDNTSMSIINDGMLSASGNGIFNKNDITMSIIGGSGVTSTWDLGNNLLSTGNSSYNNQQIVIDGAGFAGSAVVTNVGEVRWGRTNTNSTITITDGGQMNVSGGDIRLGNSYYSPWGGSNMTIGGGTATSTLTGSTSRDFYIGYGERRNSKDNVVTVSSNGVLTNVRDMFVGHVNNGQNASQIDPSTGNQLTVTGTGTASVRGLSIGYAQNAGIVSQLADANANVVEVLSGGSLSTTGAAYIGRANNNYTDSTANTMTVSGTGSSWDAGGQAVNVGYTTSATATSNNNVLTVGADSVVTNVGTLTVGNGPGTETGNQLVLDGGSVSATSVSISAGNTVSGSGAITGNTTIAGNLGIEVNGATADLVAITGDLDLSAGTDVLTVTELSAATLSTYTVVTYTGTLTGTFDTTNLPAGYSVDYSTPNQINLLTPGGSGPYDNWADGTFANGPLTDKTPTGDEDNDNLSNLLEFAFGTDPTVSSVGSLTWNGSTFTSGSPTVQHSFPGGGGVDFTVRFIRRTDHGTSGSADYALRFSSNLADWESSSAVSPPSWYDENDLDVLATQGDYQLVEYPYPIQLDNFKKARFFQVEVTEVP